MANYSGTITFFKSWKLELAKGVNLATDAFKMLLTDSYVPSSESHTQLEDITGEVETAGYARQTLQNVAWQHSGEQSVFSFDPVIFEAPDADITAERWVIYNETTNLLVCSGLLDSGGNSITIEEGYDVTFSFLGGLFALRVQE